MSPARMKMMGISTKGLHSYALQVHHLPCDEDGWIDASMYIPRNYQLVLLMTHKGAMKKGWWDGTEWDGFRLRDNDRIVSWYPYCGGSL